MNTPNIRRLMTGTLMAVLLVAACQRVERGAAGGTDTAATTTTPAPAALTVNLTEYRIEMPATLPAGRATFLITNTGKEKHNFEIEGEQLEMEVSDPLGPGQSRTLEVDLKPGTYKVYCPVANHDERGMSMQLTVQ